MAKAPSKEPKMADTPIVRSTAGLCDAVMDEIDALRNGTGSPGRANAVAKLATVALETVRVEMEVQRYLKTIPTAAATGHKDTLGAPIKLGA